MCRNPISNPNPPLKLADHFPQDWQEQKGDLGKKEESHQGEEQAQGGSRRSRLRNHLKNHAMWSSAQAGTTSQTYMSQNLFALKIFPKFFFLFIYNRYKVPKYIIRWGGFNYIYISEMQLIMYHTLEVFITHNLFLKIYLRIITLFFSFINIKYSLIKLIYTSKSLT